MALIKKPSELPVKTTIMGGIYGQPSLGKSTLALSMPRPLLLDTDGGLHRVQAEYRTDSVPVTCYDDVLNVLKEDLSDYDTIVIDTLGKLVDFMCDKAAKENPKMLQGDGTFSQKGWGVVKNYFKALVKELERLDKNLIFVAHEKETQQGDEKYIRPDVSGSSGKDIIKELDFLGYMEVVGKKRSITFMPSSKVYAKNSLQLDNYVEIPILQSGDKNTFLTDYILKPTIEKRKQEFGKKTTYEQVLKQADEIIAKKGVTEESKKELRELPKINDSVLQIANKIKEWETKNAKKA